MYKFTENKDDASANYGANNKSSVFRVHSRRRSTNPTRKTSSIEVARNPAERLNGQARDAPIRALRAGDLVSVTSNRDRKCSPARLAARGREAGRTSGYVFRARLAAARGRIRPRPRNYSRGCLCRTLRWKEISLSLIFHPRSM